jgi:hypothetical protein
MPTCSATLIDRSGTTHRYSAPGDTMAHAVTLMKAKLAVVVARVGGLTNVSYTDSMGPVNEALVAFGGPPTSFSRNLTLTLTRANLVNGARVIRNVQILDASPSYQKTGTNRGAVDITNADIISVGAQFYDADGNGDYQTRSGKYQMGFSKRGNKFARR